MERFSIVDLLVLLILQSLSFFTKQATVKRMSAILSLLPFEFVFPGASTLKTLKIRYVGSKLVCLFVQASVLVKARRY